MCVAGASCMSQLLCPDGSSVCTSWVLTVSSQGHLSTAVECFHTLHPPTGDIALFLMDSYTKGLTFFWSLESVSHLSFVMVFSTFSLKSNLSFKYHKFLLTKHTNSQIHMER